MQAAGVELSQARVLVIGLAKSGLAAIRLLAAQGARITGSDTRALEAIDGAGTLLAETGAKFIPQGGEIHRDQDLVVLSPGVPVDAEPARKATAAGIPVIGEMELASYFLQGPIAAITGSNGKTTTTSLVGHILRECGIAVQVGGNIGTPPAAMVESSRRDQWNVLEVSSFQLETISHFRARLGVALNVTPDHLDRHGTMEAYTAAKGRLFQTQQESDYAILNADDPTCVGYAAQTRARPLWFSLTRAVTPGAWVDRDRILFDDVEVMPVAEIPLRGRHNVENVLAAAVAARLAGAPLNQIGDAVRTFPGVEHRLEFVRTVNGVEYFNDSKATNVDAALKAVEAFSGGLWMILGGKDKNSDYRPLRTPLQQKGRAALLVGAAAGKIADQLEGAVPLVACGTIDAAVQHAWRQAERGDTVLLAPACASFDQFENYEHRGRVFKAAVKALEDTRRLTQ
jgi:UDP-N-acetylmuramoylalanine--D-glutamate ligase